MNPTYCGSFSPLALRPPIASSRNHYCSSSKLFLTVLFSYRALDQLRHGIHMLRWSCRARIVDQNGSCSLLKTSRGASRGAQRPRHIRARAESLFAGVDFGTSGARLIVIDGEHLVLDFTC
jgi:hypothetical protein